MALVCRHSVQENGIALARPAEAAQGVASVEATCNGHAEQGEPNTEQAAVEALPEANGHAGKWIPSCNSLWPAVTFTFQPTVSTAENALQRLKASDAWFCWLGCLSAFSPCSVCRGIRARGYDARIPCGRLRGVCNLHA